MRVEEAPSFWWQKPGFAAWALLPLSALWGLVSGWRMEMAPSVYVSVPVLCVGNFIAGGAGKTPTAIAVCEAAVKHKFKPGFLSRGHGGRTPGPLLVDPAIHHAAEVGDEPLLLAEVAPTVISVDRPAGAARLYSEPEGVAHVLVNGVEIGLPAVTSANALSRSLTVILSVSRGLSTPRPV